METERGAPSGPTFENLFALFTGLWTAGAFVDGWAHINFTATLESFFTPWHALFYAGVILTALLLFIRLLLNRWKGYPWSHALPQGFIYAFFGVCTALIAGIGDMLWHDVFGIEVGIEALLSPTHLLLALGGAITISGPLYAIWSGAKARPSFLPTILSATYLIAVITFMLQFLNPFKDPWAARSFLLDFPTELNYSIALGIGGIMLFAAILIGLVASLNKHWRFPFGSFAIMIGVNATGMVLLRGEYYGIAIAGILGGLAVDILYLLINPQKTDRRLSLFSLLAPILLFAVYFANLTITDHIIWSVHIWTGAIMISGIIGLLMSRIAKQPVTA